MGWGEMRGEYGGGSWCGWGGMRGEYGGGSWWGKGGKERGREPHEKVRPTEETENASGNHILLTKTATMIFRHAPV